MIGQDGRPLDSPSPFAQAALEADSRAFVALMSHLKTVDSEHTVLLVQVENEPGTWGSARDYSPEAEKLFTAPVPAELLKALRKQVDGPTSWRDAFATTRTSFFMRGR